MESVTLSGRYQLVLPRGVCDRLSVRPGSKLTVVAKGGVIYLVPERPMKAFRGIVRGATGEGLRDRKNRF
ncbi:MAG: AbrB/MazE/SpoVT family DNA-binding domain-containing protein [bacterium]|nr:AbrB/MazE/SpoVT family DNA-binding domain-containing protein [bacterium]